MPSNSPAGPPVRGWTGYPLGFLAATTVTILTVAAGGTAHPQWTLVALAGTAAATATVTTLRAALATAALCWAMQAGFILGRHGDLAFTTASARAATILAAAAVLSTMLATAIRHTGPPPARSQCRPHETHGPVPRVHRHPGPPPDQHDPAHRGHPRPEAARASNVAPRPTKPEDSRDGRFPPAGA